MGEVVNALGLGVKIYQSATGDESGFSYEDLGPNAAGVDFGDDHAEVVQQMLRAVAVLHKLHKPQVAVIAVKDLRTDDRYQNALTQRLRHEEIIADTVWSFTVLIRGFHGNVFL
jgi:hypothetical protein